MEQHPMSAEEFRQMVVLIRRFGDEIDQWDAFRVTTPAGFRVYVSISMQPEPAYPPEHYRDVDRVWSEDA